MQNASQIQGDLHVLKGHITYEISRYNAHTSSLYKSLRLLTLHDMLKVNVLKFYQRNQTTANADKFQSILLSRGSTSDFLFNVGGHSIPPNNTLKMLGGTLDDKLNFKTHIRKVCQKASRRINALKRISKFLNEQCRMRVYKSYFFANFNYCPVVWMFCGKTNLGKLERLQERALSTMFLEKSLSYNELLKKSGQLSVKWI